MNAVAVTVQIIGMLGSTALLFGVGGRPKGRPAYECVDLRMCGRTNLPSVHMLQLGLRVSDLKQSLALYSALGYAELGSVPQTEFGSPHSATVDASGTRFRFDLDSRGFGLVFADRLELPGLAFLFPVVASGHQLVNDLLAGWRREP